MSPSPSTNANRSSQVDWPPPDAAAQAQSEALIAHIREQIESAGGVLRFDRFMAMALYQPGLGYYSGGATKFGAAGDFVTAPELSPLFSRALANQCAELFELIGERDLLELGAGSGVMAVELLTTLAELEQLPRRYLILELSGALRQRQQVRLREALAPELYARVTWLERLPEAFRGVILANELLDAMPVRRFRVAERGPSGEMQLEELAVIWREERFAWQLIPAERTLAASVQALEVDLPADYLSELNPALPGWFAALSASCQLGVALIFDYGYPRHEFYLPERNRGTLTCHYRHRAHGDPLAFPGLQDITAHVDFTAVVEAASRADWRLLGYTSQAQFLLGNGLLQWLAESQTAARHANPNATSSDWALAQAVRQLTLPGEMGERFQVMALARGVEPSGALSGFSLRDLSHRL